MKPLSLTRWMWSKYLQLHRSKMIALRCLCLLSFASCCGYSWHATTAAAAARLSPPFLVIFHCPAHLHAAPPPLRRRCNRRTHCSKVGCFRWHVGRRADMVHRSEPNTMRQCSPTHGAFVVMLCPPAAQARAVIEVPATGPK